MRLKSCESPERQGQNNKSRQASARLRQLKKQTKTWKNKVTSPE